MNLNNQAMAYIEGGPRTGPIVKFQIQSKHFIMHFT